MYIFIPVVDASCVNCQEKIEKLKAPDFMKPKKSLTSDYTLGIFVTIK